MNRGTALVTGVKARIGKTVAEALRDDGWRVIGQVRDQNDPVPDGVERIAGDLSRPDIGTNLYAQVEGEAPSLLVNVAARFAEDSLGSLSSDEFEAHMAVNVRAPALIAEAFADAHEGGEAMIVNILDAKLAAPNPDYLSYTLSKSALAGWTDIAARAWAGAGVRVNAIAPALMLPSGDMEENDFEMVHDLNPLGHGVEPGELVGALRYLIDAPGVTGETLTLDAGQRFLALPRDVAFIDVEDE
ncbi:SDR family oxidoreductase [Sphingomicrobium clamense]|uniref:SDR family oxidoreductase n=1 Tax=Sphingomicrobium clamense TaxID=2851013 RepID=A0ABS6V792_9SPHN|nr:SDR family oxidoreductase [Sphingomicrobium sp. B8]MBW0145439.1 SDR family oxidoreductase [Sphingomicrobium sp. B8]